MSLLIDESKTYKIVGAAMKVHRELGFGFLEAVYQEAFEYELKLLQIPHTREARLPLYYRGERMRKEYAADFLCYDSIIVELKALKAIGGSEKAQVLNYLKASQCRLGLLLNFGSTSLQHERLVL